MKSPSRTMPRTLVLAILFAAFFAPQLQAQTIVIVHPSVNVKSLGSKELLDVYTLNQTRWDDGGRIVVFDLKAGKPKEALLDYVGMSEEELKKIWLRKQFTGKARPPRSISSEEEIVDLVAETEGAIGYVNERSLKSGKNVRIVARIK